jgi:isopropylmalate/homocitrate/citramalate synthase
MLYKILGLTLILSQAASHVFACNNKLLNMEADSLHSRISSAVPVTVSQIQKSLDFLQDTQQLNKKYVDSQSFQHFYSHLSKNVTDEAFKDFSEKCKSLYNAKQSNELTKAAIFLLLEKVYNKHKVIVQMQERYKQASKKHLQNTVFPDADRLVDEFFNTTQGAQVK